jgi:hypothetical protein
MSPFDAAGVVLTEVGRLCAELLIALHVDPVRAVVEVEVVHVLRAEQHRQRIRHLANGQAERSRLVAIDRDDELRIVRRERREQSGHASRLVTRARHLLGDARKLGDLAAAKVENLHLESAERGDALNRRRCDWNDHCAGNAEHLAAQSIQHSIERVLCALAFFEAPSAARTSRPLFDAAPLKLKPATEKTPAISGCLK